jgi:exodeoxyribonuclease V alpha subunit
MKELTQLEGTVESLIYQNPDNGFTVFTLACPEPEETLTTCVGSLPYLNVGERIKVKGAYVNNPRYGLQLSVDSFEKMIPNTLEGIEKYLGSGVIKGIGEKTARRIVKRFGAETFEIMADTPQRLAEIKGITPEKALTMGEAFHAQAELRRAMFFLQDYGVSPIYALKIYKQYREATEDVVKANPYCLADDIAGIGFKTADAIAGRVGIPLDSPFRLMAGLRYVLRQASSGGHVYLPKDVLIRDASEILQAPEELTANALAALLMENKVCQEINGDETAVYLQPFHRAETYVAQKLLTLADNVLHKSASVYAEIAALEAKNGIRLADKQKEAAAEAIASGVLVITGGPGTGKTTAIKTIIQIMRKDRFTIELAAPTGRAAKRMSEATGMEAKTIHRLLEVSYMSDDAHTQKFQRNEDRPLQTDVVIIDESSMVDILLMHSLLKAIAPGTRLILVGDVDQLPSVGPGHVLRDVIDSGCLNVVRLTEIFRQAQESAIIMNAHRINRGEYPILNEKNKDFFFVKREAAESVVSTIIDLILRRLPGFIDLDKIQDIQVLTPMRKSNLGVTSLNQALQDRLNPPSPEKKEKEFRTTTFREGDKVMQIRNNYSLGWQISNEWGAPMEEGAGVFNGDEGVIRAINDEEEFMTVCFDDRRTVHYDFAQLEELELSYAITIHKSQGSEYKAVIIPIYSGPPMLLTKNLLYTAVTRAKELAVIVGLPEMLYRMVDNHREVNRYTSLADRIRKMSQQIETNTAAAVAANAAVVSGA